MESVKREPPLDTTSKASLLLITEAARLMGRELTADPHGIPCRSTHLISEESAVWMQLKPYEVPQMASECTPATYTGVLSEKSMIMLWMRNGLVWADVKSELLEVVPVGGKDTLSTFKTFPEDRARRMEGVADVGVSVMAMAVILKDASQNQSIIKGLAEEVSLVTRTPPHLWPCVLKEM
jgi:hypothetical protein